MNLRKIAAPYYLFVLLLHCIFLGLEWTMASKFTKPLLMPLLILYLYKALKSSFPELAKTDHSGNMLSVRPINKSIIVLAFVASWAGDLFLMFEGQWLFIAGMVSFMTAHISYCYLFNQIQPFKRKNAMYPVLLGAFVLHLGTDVMNIIRPNLGDLLIPVYIYMFVITLMAVYAFMTMAVKDTEYCGKYFFAPGAAFFVVSDMILALNIFALHEPFLGICVMVTYGIAQYLIAKGFYSYVQRT
ncbi:MAG: hypothetical protein RI983_1234 [Bacteroidota bacterium]|jgi:uncharacterized membrane protein YhhN